ncbi:NUDIX domain-containing protein [Psychrobacillus sp. NPDC058041]|uniref:NUDIX domain-containing protein n=1 Tax=Psychrobacillus sp. NPDC058041 TaxID=3346310 RepID=UPI0036D7BB70
MLLYRDLNGAKVELSFEKRVFPIEPLHVLVIAKHQNKWLLTKHPKRGIEFPGGKIEGNETTVQGAIRETMEETNVSIENVEWIAEYLVHDVIPFCKAVFIAKVAHIIEEGTSFETDGPIWLTTEEFLTCEHLSFHMKDAGMQAILEKVIEHENKWNDRKDQSLSITKSTY